MANMHPKILLALAGSLAVACLSFYNGFPFITGDTASYLNGAWERTVPYERPVFYGWFLTITSLHYTLWFSLLAQCFVVFWILKQAIYKFTSLKNTKSVFAALVLALLCTQVGWEANKLLPDVYAGLALLLILLYFDTTTKLRALYLLLLVIIGTFHNTHFVVYFLLAISLLFLRIWSPLFSRKKTSILILISFVSLGLVGLSNQIDHGKFELGRSTEVFLVGQAAESGLLYGLLCKECDTKKWELCRYKDSLPLRGWQYVWNQSSPVEKLGGWNAMRTEHRDILSTLYGTPRNWPKLVISSFFRALTMSFQVDAGDAIFSYGPQTNIQQSIKKYYPIDISAAGWTRQLLQSIPFSFFNYWYFLVNSALLIALLWLWKTSKLSSSEINRIIFCLLAIFINSWTVAQFANISDRLNTRVFWVLPFIVLLILLDKKEHIKS